MSHIPILTEVDSLFQNLAYGIALFTNNMVGIGIESAKEAPYLYVLHVINNQFVIPLFRYLLQQMSKNLIIDEDYHTDFVGSLNTLAAEMSERGSPQIWIDLWVKFTLARYWIGVAVETAKYCLSKIGQKKLP
jgi:hypothetical protein